MNEKNTQNVIPNVNSKKKEERNVPDLRYKEFSDEWIISNISNEFTLLTNNSLSRDDLNYDCGCRKNIHYGDILTKYTTVKNITDNDIPYINDNIKISNSSIKLISGDIIVADTAEDYTVGKAIEIYDLNSLEVYGGLHTIPLRPKHKFAVGYLAYYFNSYNHKKRIFPLIQGIKVYSISKSALSSSIIKFPTLEEQNKIAQILIKIDARISTQKKIIEDLIELKKGIINSTFNKYKYYKKIKLSMVLKERKKYAIKESNIIHATLSKEGIFPKTDRYNRDFLVKDEEKNYKISLLNDICYNPANLKFGVITRNKFGKCIISPIYITYEVDDKFLPDFVELYVCQNSFINYIRKYERGTVYERMAVNSEDFLKGEIPFLSYEIQSLLVNKIKLIEEKIQNEKSILQLYIKEKEYFLNSLFI